MPSLSTMSSVENRQRLYIMSESVSNDCMSSSLALVCDLASMMKLEESKSTFAPLTTANPSVTPPRLVHLGFLCENHPTPAVFHRLVLIARNILKTASVLDFSALRRLLYLRERNKTKVSPYQVCTSFQLRLLHRRKGRKSDKRAQKQRWRHPCYATCTCTRRPLRFWRTDIRNMMSVSWGSSVRG